MTLVLFWPVTDCNADNRDQDQLFVPKPSQYTISFHSYHTRSPNSWTVKLGFEVNAKFYSLFPTAFLQLLQKRVNFIIRPSFLRRNSFIEIRSIQSFTDCSYKHRLLCIQNSVNDLKP